MAKERWKHLSKHPQITDKIEDLQETLIVTTYFVENLE